MSHCYSNGTDGKCMEQSSSYQAFKNSSSFTSPIAISHDSHPLRTYETKMAARTGKRSILTILRNTLTKGRVTLF